MILNIIGDFDRGGPNLLEEIIQGGVQRYVDVDVGEEQTISQLEEVSEVVNHPRAKTTMRATCNTEHCTVRIGNSNRVMICWPCRGQNWWTNHEQHQL